MHLVPSTSRKAERILWFVVLAVLVLSAVFMIGLWE